MRSTLWRNPRGLFGCSVAGTPSLGGGPTKMTIKFLLVQFGQIGPSLSYRGSENLQQATPKSRNWQHCEIQTPFLVDMDVEKFSRILFYMLQSGNFFNLFFKEYGSKNFLFPPARSPTFSRKNLFGWDSQGIILNGEKFKFQTRLASYDDLYYLLTSDSQAFQFTFLLNFEIRS